MKIKKIDVKGKNRNVINDLAPNEITPESKLDLTTKILIVLFAVLMLIVIFAKKFGIEGFP